MHTKIPNFFVMGAQKCATTSLQNYLCKSPEVYLPEQKETKFFVKPEEYIKGFEYYVDRYYADVGAENVIGEIDPDYMYFPDGIINMSKCMDLKKVKMIYLLRDPVDRAFSHYLMTYRRGLESLSFEQAIAIEEDRINKNWLSNMHYSYINRGKYINQLERIEKYVSRDKMLFILTEDLKKDPLSVMNSIGEFLGVQVDIDMGMVSTEYHKRAVPKSAALLRFLQKESSLKSMVRFLLPLKNLRQSLLIKLVKLNETDKVEGLTMEPETRQRLKAYFSEYNKKLSDFIDKDLSAWC